MAKLCQRSKCADPATQVVYAEDTQHRLLVCAGDVGWAKEQIEQDFPGRVVLKESMQPIFDRWGELSSFELAEQIDDADMDGA